MTEVEPTYDDEADGQEHDEANTQAPLTMYESIVSQCGRIPPMYKCHKVVQAIEIDQVVVTADPHEETDPGLQQEGMRNCYQIWPKDTTMKPFYIRGSWYDRHKPENGGYIVVYSDGYVSYSPKDSFEEGYTDLNHFGDRIARICHNVNAAYCAAMGDLTQMSWDFAPEWQKESARNGVMFHLNNPDVTPEESHNNWLAVKNAEGWTYGEEKDPQKKTHPCIVPFDELPLEQKAKDFLFKEIVRSCSTYL